jgi:GT2 family glycosyltransferase
MDERYVLTVCSLGENPNLITCIDSLLKIKAASNKIIDILLVLNKEKSEKIYSSDIIVHYEPLRGYSNVRNKAVSVISKNSNLIFIDDDEVASETWFEALVAMHQRFPNDLIFGAVIPGAESSGNSYREKFLKYFDQLSDGSTAKRAGAGNLLIPSNLLNLNLIHFDSIFNLTGSEDSDLCFRLRNYGVKIRYAKDAILHEVQANQRFDSVYLDSRYVREVSNYSVVIRRNSNMYIKYWRFTTLVVRIFLYSTLALFNRKYKLKKRAFMSSFLAFMSGSPVL